MTASSDDDNKAEDAVDRQRKGKGRAKGNDARRPPPPRPRRRDGGGGSARLNFEDLLDLMVHHDEAAVAFSGPFAEMNASQQNVSAARQTWQLRSRHVGAPAAEAAGGETTPQPPTACAQVDWWTPVASSAGGGSASSSGDDDDDDELDEHDEPDEPGGASKASRAGRVTSTSSVVSMPAILTYYFDSEFYLLQHRGVSAPLYTILYALAPFSASLPPVDQRKLACRLKRRIASALRTMFKTHRYNQMGYRIKKIQALLAHDDEYSDALGHIISDYFQVNILVLDVHHPEGRLYDADGATDGATDGAAASGAPPLSYRNIGQYVETRPTIVLCARAGSGMHAWDAVVHRNMNSHVFDDVRFIHNDVPRSSEPLRGGSTQSLGTELDKETIAEIRQCVDRMKMDELCALARSLDIPTERDDNPRKRKLKAVLAREIFEQATH